MHKILKVLQVLLILYLALLQQITHRTKQWKLRELLTKCSATYNLENNLSSEENYFVESAPTPPHLTSINFSSLVRLIFYRHDVSTFLGPILPNFNVRFFQTSIHWLPVCTKRRESSHLHPVYQSIWLLREFLCYAIRSDGTGPSDRFSEMRINWWISYTIQATKLVRSYHIKPLQCGSSIYYER